MIESISQRQRWAHEQRRRMRIMFSHFVFTNSFNKLTINMEYTKYIYVI